MSLPKTIPVMGIKFKIVEVGSPELDGEKCEAHISITAREITIKRDLPMEVKLTLLAHEYMHGMIKLSGLSQVLGEKREEALCCMAETMVQGWLPK